MRRPRPFAEQTHACFSWAARLDPTRPEPYYGDWIISRREDSTALRRSLLLDPFVHHARVVMFAAPPQALVMSSGTRGWEQLRAGNYFVASPSQSFETYLRHRPHDLVARWGMAIALYYRQKYLESAAQVRFVEEVRRRRQAERLEHVYRSLEIENYMEATPSLAGGARDSASTAISPAR